MFSSGTPLEKLSEGKYEDLFIAALREGFKNRFSSFPNRIFIVQIGSSKSYGGGFVSPVSKCNACR